MNAADRISSSARRRFVIVGTTLACLVVVEVAVRSGEDVVKQFYRQPYARKYDALMGLPRKPEIILLGSSRVKYALVPEEFERATGKRAFNLGLAGSKVIEWQLIANNCIKPLEPSLVILGVNASAIRADYLPVPAAMRLFTFRDLVSYLVSDGWSGEVLGHYCTRNIGRHCALFYRRFGVKMLIQEQLGFILPKHAQQAIEQRMIANKRCPPDGYEHPWLYGRQLRTLADKLEEEPDRVLAGSVPAFSPDARVIDHFAKLLRWFNEQGIPLIVAYVPNSPRTESRWKAVEPAMAQIIESVCHANGIPFVSCDRDELPRNNDDYFEELHVTLPMARRMSRRIAERITALGLLDRAGTSLAGSSELDVDVP